MDCLSRLVEVPEHNAPAANILINAITTIPVDEPTTCSWSKTKALVEVSPPDASKVNALPSLTGDCRDTWLRMQWTDPFCKHISKWLINGKATHYELDMFIHIDGLLYKYAMDTSQKYLALVIPQSWCFTVLVEAYDKLGHQEVTRTYHLIKQQYYWKGMNKDINTTFQIAPRVRGRKQKCRCIPYRWWIYQFDKIAIYLIMDLNVFLSGNQHNVTIIDHLTGWSEAFPIPDKEVDTIIHVFIHNYMPVHICPRYILSNNGTEYKNQLMGDILQQPGIDWIISAPYHP